MQIYKAKPFLPDEALIFRHHDLLMKLILVLIISIPLVLLSSHAGDWPQWLGPNRDGVGVDEKLIQPKSGEEFPVLWKVPLGEGWASPVISHGKLVIHHRPGAEESIDCLDVLSGRILWRHSFPSGYRDGFGMAEGPRSTPTISGDGVFTYGPQGILNCLDFRTGKLKWKEDVSKKFRSPKGFFGRCCSPLVVGNLVMLDVGGPGAGVVAFDKENGKVLWKSTDHENDYSSPAYLKVGNVACSVFFLREGFLGLESKTGRHLFFARFRSPINASVNAATPLVVGDSVFVSSCYDVGGALWKLKPDGKGQVSTQTLWKKGGSLDSHYATAVHHQGYLYGFHGRQERGPELRCVSLVDGSVRWTTGRISAGNLLLADGKLLVLTEDGEFILAAASPRNFKALHRQQLLGLETRAHFALSDGRLFARDKRLLVCLNLKRGTP